MNETFSLDAVLTAQGLGGHAPGETIGLEPEQLQGSTSSLEEALLDPADDSEPLRDPARDLEALSTLGVGGMGAVTLSLQRSLGREVAVKTLLPHRRGGRGVRALLREARLLATLEHPHIVPVHVLGWDDTAGPLLVMKRIPGTAWQALIHDPGHAGWEELDGDRLERHIDILGDVCQAASFAHSRGIVHRDIKPENVMVGQFGEVYLVDWGIAARDSGPLPEAGRLVGTPAYMAPEMVTGAHPLSARTDVFLLGGCLYEVLTGSPRNTVDDGGTPQVLARAVEAAPGTYPDGTPEELIQICERACAPDPSARFESARALREALRAYLRHRSAISTAAAAQDRLRQLQAVLSGGDPEPSEVHRLFNESRFGFEEARRQWPANPATTAGLQGTLEAMIGYALREEDARLAAALLDELPEARPALRQALRDLEARRSAEQAASARLQQLEADMRFKGIDLVRTRATLLNGAFTAIILVIAGASFRSLGDPMAAWLNMGLLLVCAVMLAASLITFRDRLFNTARYRRLMAAHSLWVVLLFFNRLATLVMGLSTHETLLLDAATTAAVVGSLASVGFRALRFSLGLVVVGMPVALWAWPYSLEVFAVGYLINTAWLARALLPDQAETAEG